jgi:hypothetical protein
MAVSFPLDAATFMDQLLIKNIKFDIPENVEMNMTGGGELLRADLAPMLWTGDVRLGQMLLNEAATVQGLLDLLRGPARSFYAYDPRRPAPLLDPTGSVLGAAAPTLHTIGANKRDIRLQALPTGYRLSRGDYLAFDYGTAPVRRALHRVFTSLVTTAIGGITPTFEITPPLRDGAVVGAAVTLLKASCKAVIVPNSIDTGNSAKSVTDGMVFKFQQSLR